MSMDEAYKVAQLIEKKRLGTLASGIPTTGDQMLADDIDQIYEAEFNRRLTAALAVERTLAAGRLKDAQYSVLNDAVRAYSRECVGFQHGWGSNELDQAKVSMLDKTLTWLKQRRDKYIDVLPRYINLKQTYESLSDGAQIEVDSVIYTYRSGFGTFHSEDGAIIRGLTFNKQVKLIDHNLTERDK